MKRIDCSGWTPEKMHAELTKDFLDRDATTFVKIRRHDRLGWESSLPAGGSYSDYINNEKDVKEVLKKAYSLASHVVSVMDTPYRIHLKISNDGSSYTDSQNVYLATDVFDDPDMTTGQKLDTFLGIAVHESCHLKWTDFEAYQKDEDNKNELIHNLWNIIEDERIERLCGEDSPGFANYLTMTKYFIFDKNERTAEEKMAAQGYTDADMPLYARVQNAILHKVRYPASLNDLEIKDFGETLVNATAILTPYPKDTKQAFLRAKDIYELIVDEYAKEIQKEQQQPQMQMPQGSDGSGNGDQEQQSAGGGSSDGQQNPEGEEQNGEGQSNGQDRKNGQSQGDGQGTGGEKTDQSEGQGSSNGMEQGEKGGSQSAGQNSGNGLDDPELRKKAKERLEKELNAQNELNNIIRQMMQGLAQGPKNGLTKEGAQKLANPWGAGGSMLDQKEMCTEVLKDIDKTREIEGEVDIVNDVVFEKQKNDIDSYRESYRRVQRYITPIANALRLHDKHYDDRITGLRSGRIDMNKIVDIYSGSQTVYTRQSKTRTEKACVCVLIDESGSMCGERAQMARDTSVLLIEALKRVENVDLYVYGFTNSRRVDINVYKENNFGNRFAAGKISAYNGTPTGEAVKAVTDRVRKFTQEKCLMFVLTDGQPNSTRALVEAKAYAAKNNVTTFGIGIKCNTDKAGFDYGMRIDRLDQMAQTLGKEVKKATVKNTKSRTL